MARKRRVNGHDILTVKEVADLLRMSEQNIRILAKSGKLPGRQFGRAWRFSRAQILALIPGDQAKQGDQA